MRRLRLIAIFAALAVLAFLMLASFARSMLYPSPPVAVPSPPGGDLGEERLSLATGSEVYAWSLEPANLATGRPVTVFLHGNGENLETMRRSGLFDRLRRMEVVTLVIDYPGYGRSGGRTNEEGVIASAGAGIDWARENHPERPVVLVGWSLGAAAALGAASRRPDQVVGVAVLSPWSTLAEVAAAHFPRFLVSWAVKERYDNLEAARMIARRGVPTLVVHGERDTIIPAEQGRRVTQALRQSYSAETGAPTTWLGILEAGHNDLLSYAEVWQALERFLDDTTGDPGSA